MLPVATVDFPFPGNYDTYFAFLERTKQLLRLALLLSALSISFCFPLPASCHSFIHLVTLLPKSVSSPIFLTFLFLCLHPPLPRSSLHLLLPPSCPNFPSSLFPLISPSFLSIFPLTSSPLFMFSLSHSLCPHSPPFPSFFLSPFELESHLAFCDAFLDANQATGRHKDDVAMEEAVGGRGISSMSALAL